MLDALESELLSLKTTAKNEPILPFYKLWHLLKPFRELDQFQRTFWENLTNIRNSYKALEIKGLITTTITKKHGGCFLISRKFSRSFRVKHLILRVLLC